MFWTPSDKYRKRWLPARDRPPARERIPTPSPKPTTSPSTDTPAVETSDGRRIHPGFPGRDIYGRILSKPYWGQLPDELRGNQYGRIFTKSKVNRQCRICGALFEGQVTQRYCSPHCKRRAAEQKKVNARKVTPRTLSLGMRESLSIYNRSERDPKAYDPSKPWHEQPKPGPVLLLPLSTELEDALAALLSRPLREIVAPTSQPPLLAKGKEIYAGREDRLIHDLLLGALRSIVRNAGRKRSRK